jgi:Flp pilus assembly protein TadG
MKTMSRMLLALRHRAVDMLADCRGIAATEFAVIVPIMLVLLFGTIELSSAVAVDRKVTLIARTLSDLTSQGPQTAPNSVSATIDATYLTNVFTASISIMTGYPPVPTKATITEIYVDSNQVATVQWSQAAVIASNTDVQATLVPCATPTTCRNAGDIVTPLVPTQLLVRQTYLILSEVSYLYLPTIGYVMSKTTGVNLADVAFTRPRQAVCVIYNNAPASTCPTP